MRRLLSERASLVVASVTVDVAEASDSTSLKSEDKGVEARG